MDFPLILFIALLASGGIILLYRFISLFWHSEKEVDMASRKEPRIVEYAKAFFPVILIVFVLRSFIVEPFRIPSGSMLPSLHIGDFILVNKFTYGIRLPVVNNKIYSIGQPQRGDVIVFRYPLDLKLNFIKRVVGLPGDVLAYKNKQLSINGVEVTSMDNEKFTLETGNHESRLVDQFIETIGDSSHTIIIDSERRTRDLDKVTVPDGHYFVMGDNRDHSNDSRYWKFVPENNVVGKAFFIWFNWKGPDNGWVAWDRIGNMID